LATFLFHAFCQELIVILMLLKRAVEA